MTLFDNPLYDENDVEDFEEFVDFYSIDEDEENELYFDERDEE